MNYLDFLQELQENISNRLGSEYSVTTKKILKNNSVELDGLMIRSPGACVIPSIYVNHLYPELEKGRTIDDIADEVLEIYNTSGSRFADESPLRLEDSEPEKRVIFKLVNYEKNRRLLEEMPHMRVEDLAVIFCYLVSDDDEGIATVRITNENVGVFKLCPDKLHEYAFENTERLFPAGLDDICTVMLRLAGTGLKGREDNQEVLNSIKESFEATRDKMYVLTNGKGINGAACLLYSGMLERIYNEMGSFYILPSSVNEVIIVPENENTNYDSLYEMVPAINREQVPECEILSDSVYKYPENPFKLSDIINEGDSGETA